MDIRTIKCKIKSNQSINICAASFNPLLTTELHRDPSSTEIAVAYLSRKTNQSETTYHSYGIENLAIVESMEHFRLRFTVCT